MVAGKASAKGDKEAEVHVSPKDMKKLKEEDEDDYGPANFDFGGPNGEQGNNIDEKVAKDEDDGGRRKRQKKESDTLDKDHSESHKGAKSSSVKKPASGDGCVALWFRVDLRTIDNPALHAAAEAAAKRNVPLVTFYVTCPGDYTSHNVAPIRTDFHLRSVAVLKERLKPLNIPLLCLTVEKSDSVGSEVLELCSRLGASEIYWNIEYEVDERARDEKLMPALEKAGVSVHEYHDQCVVKPTTLHSGTGNPYTVFTPYRKCWEQHVLRNRHLIETLPAPKKVAATTPEDVKSIIAEYDKVPSAKEIVGFSKQESEEASKNWPAGEGEAQNRLDKFLAARINGYKDSRDIPSDESGTSALSPFLNAGCICSRQCISLAVKANNNKINSGQLGAITWISELVWRDFYRTIMVEFPRVAKYRAFKKETEKVEWVQDEKAFKAWCEGKTGYPIVDAGMRQLNKLGWMHNRLRMITASFLAKDLLIDWRKGEKYFSERLIDGDLASNNGGWQWSASTGCDPQPYFRIFSPLRQSERFDESGKSIRKWVPELKDVVGDAVHAPYERMSKGAFEKLGYPKPIVDHKMARERAIAAFKKAAGK